VIQIKRKVRLFARLALQVRDESANARAYKELAPVGKTIGIPFLLLGITLAIAGVCWLNRRVWGWRFAVAIIATQVLGDFVNALRGDLVRGLVGFLIASALLVYLLNARVRAAFV